MAQLLVPSGMRLSARISCGGSEESSMKRPGFQSRILVALTLISLILGQTMFSAQAQDATPEAADAATPDAIAADPTATATSTLPTATAAPTQTATTAPSPTSTKIPTAVPPTATSKPAFTGSATPTITISPTTGRVDTNLKVIVAGFPANVTVYIKFDDTVMTKLTSSSTGGGTTYFKVPAGPKGPHIVKAVAGSISAKTTFTMIPRIRLSPVSGWIGSSLGISLRGYTPGERRDSLVRHRNDLQGAQVGHHVQHRQRQYNGSRAVRPHRRP